MAKLEEKNPWHKDYGVLKNTIYILKKEKEKAIFEQKREREELRARYREIWDKYFKT